MWRITPLFLFLFFFFFFFSFQDLDADRSGTVSAKEFLAFGKPYEPLKDLEEEGPVYGREVDLVAD